MKPDETYMDTECRALFLSSEINSRENETEKHDCYVGTDALIGTIDMFKHVGALDTCSAAVQKVSSIPLNEESPGAKPLPPL